MKSKLFFLFGIGWMGLLVACSAAITENLDGTLTASSANTLSAQATLAMGTLQLEETAYAVTADQVPELLFLWQAMQTLATDDATSAIEMDALVSQIESTMTAAQIEAINAMELTGDAMAGMAPNGAAGMANDTAADAGTAAGSPPADAALMGGGPGGELAMGATMPTEDGEMPEMTDGSGMGQMQEQMLTTAVIQLLQEKGMES